VDDFHITESPQAIHVLNAPSPGATASLAIGRHIADLSAASFGLQINTEVVHAPTTETQPHP